MSRPAIPFLVLVPSDEIHDSDALFAIATAYAHSGLIIRRYGHESDQMTVTFPAAVCSSFALELFLKFFVMVGLIEKGEYSKKGRPVHTIPTLWASISPAHKALIAGMFKNETGQPHTNGLESRLQSFEDALRYVGDQPFVHWRYAHELQSHQMLPHGAITLVVDALGYAAQYLKNQPQTTQANSDDESHVDQT